MKSQTLTQKWTVFIFVMVLLVSVVPDISYGQGSKKIYWTEKGKIRRANLDGSNVEDILTELEWPNDIVLDIHNLKMYWTDTGSNNILRSNLDGSNIEEVLDGEDENKPYSIALDTDVNKIYWGNNLPWEIRRINYDGSNIEAIKIKPADEGVFGITVDAESIELDVKAGKMYFADSLNDNIGRADLDGSNYEELRIGIIDPTGLAFDLRDRKMYSTHILLGEIKCASLNGDNVKRFLTELNGPTDIALDIRSRKMYWVERDTQEHNGKIIHKHKIRRANLDGSNITDILTGLNTVRGIALDTEGVYDVSPDTNKLTTIWADMKTQ